MVKSICKVEREEIFMDKLIHKYSVHFNSQMNNSVFTDIPSVNSKLIRGGVCQAL